jgi:hypothetical protein
VDNTEAKIEFRATADDQNRPTLKLSVRRNVGWGWSSLLRYFFKGNGN